MGIREAGHDTMTGKKRSRQRERCSGLDVKLAGFIVPSKSKKSKF